MVEDQRVMRLALPVPLIREMDAAIIQGIGGYSTRAEFILDAIQERLIDLTVADEIDAGAPLADDATQDLPEVGSDQPDSPLPARAETLNVNEGTATFDVTRIRSQSTGFTWQTAPARLESRPLFGLHNRDYPSLWALEQLAEFTSERPAPIEAYYGHVLAEAWTFGERLLELERTTGVRCAGMFPTNREKKKSAEAGFRSFAIGDYRAEGGGVTTSGPLFEWAAAAVQLEGDELVVGMTAAGRSLLRAVSGMTAGHPHDQLPAIAFLEHLRSTAPGDWMGFSELLRAIGADGTTRRAVLERFAEVWPDWSENEVSTNAAGYVARAREWGLVELKQDAGKYLLTPFGADELDRVMKGTI